MPKKRTIQSNPYLAKNARCRFQWLITKGLAGRGFKNGCLTPNGYTLTSVLVTAVLMGIITVPLMKISMQVGVTQQRSLNREKARFKALSIAQVGQKSNDISKVEALASEKDCTVEGTDGVYLATCTVGFTKQSLGTGSKAFVMCEDNQLSELMKKVKPGREIYKGENNYYTIVDGPTWEEAEANAVKLGGHLVTINDASENSFLTSFMGLENIYNSAFIGFKNGSWVNGQSFTYNNFHPDIKSNPNLYYSQYPYAEIWAPSADKIKKSWQVDVKPGVWNTALNDQDGRNQKGIAEIPRNSASNENDAQNCEG